MRPIHILLAILLLAAVPPAHANLPDFYVMDYNPKIVEPGETYNLTIVLKNLGTRRASYVKVDLNFNETSPIYPLGGMKAYVGDPKPARESTLVAGEGYFGIIHQGDEVHISFPIYVKRNTSEGAYSTELTFRWFQETEFEKGYQGVTLVMYVKKVDPALEMEKALPAYVKPERDFPVGIKLLNTGNVGLKNLDVNVSTGNASTLQSKTPNNFHFEGLMPGESLPLNLTFITNKNTPTGIYTIPINLRFESYGGFIKEQTETLPIMVRGFATIDIGGVGTDPIRVVSGESFTLNIKVENVEFEKAKAVKVFIDLPFTGNREAFIGELKRDDDAPAIFVLKAGEPGEYRYKVRIEYLDDTGRQALEENLILVVYPGRGGLSPLAIGGLVFFLLVGYLLWRRAMTPIQVYLRWREGR